MVVSELQPSKFIIPALTFILNLNKFTGIFVKLLQLRNVL